MTRAGPSVAIESIERNDESATVYNFEVEGFHTYFVGKVNDGVWVHNDSLTDRMATGHAWDEHVLEERQFNDLPSGPIVTQQQFSSYIRSVMRNPTARKIADEGLEDERIYYFHEQDRVMVVIWKKEGGDNVYRNKSTCFRISRSDPWDYFDDQPGRLMQTP